MKRASHDMDMPDDSKRSGKFTVPPGREIYGELTLAGNETSLYLQDNEDFSTHAIPGRCIRGVLHDLTRISLIDCVTMSGMGSASRRDESYRFATIFPHFVLSGGMHLDPEERNIVKVHFVVDDASTLFYDFDAFGVVLDAKPFIEEIAHANALPREIATGSDPKILYFTGKREIFAADTVLGRICATHNPVQTLGSPNGVWLKNTIVVTITFEAPLLFHEAISRTSTLLRYLSVLVGRPQNLVNLNVEIDSQEPHPILLQVHWSMPPKRSLTHQEQKPHPSDVLLDAVRRTDDFTRVLANWLDRDQDWQDARGMFFNCFGEQNVYTTDRLIGAANMFDILPSSAVPSNFKLPTDIETAREISREAFAALPHSPERDSVLSALGRIGKPALKRKIRHRAQLIIDALGGELSDLPTITDEAVNCRNYYVHGADPRFDYNANLDCVNFFTDTLEFVFAASDLVQAGWDVRTWSVMHTTMSHPFTRFLVNYTARLLELKSVLPSRAST
jgi:ApeA N-terminal domain 1